jgi:hypothetical protein
MLLQIQSGSSLNGYKCENKRLKYMYIVLLIIINKPALYIPVKCKNCVFI